MSDPFGAIGNVANQATSAVGGVAQTASTAVTGVAQTASSAVTGAEETASSAVGGAISTAAAAVASTEAEVQNIIGNILEEAERIDELYHASPVAARTPDAHMSRN